VLPEHLRALPKIRPVQGTLVVEASSWLEDNQWLLDMAEKDSFVVGVIGKLLPDSPEFGAQLKRFASNPLFRGIRVSATAISAELARNNTEPLELLANLGLTLDLIGENCAALAPKLAEQFPKLQIVINHIGSTTITPAGPSKEWQNGIEAAAKHQNVFIKVSALMESAATNGQTAPATPEIYHPYVSAIWNAFGDERVIYGSNWPVSERAGDYASLQQLALHFAEARGVTAARNFFALNSKRAYRWPERTGRKPSLQTSKP
jgi:predicted TIM-barrel fold metal-dependent hydrolase